MKKLKKHNKNLKRKEIKVNPEFPSIDNLINQLEKKRMEMETLLVMLQVSEECEFKIFKKNKNTKYLFDKLNELKEDNKKFMANSEEILQKFKLLDLYRVIATKKQ